MQSVPPDVQPVNIDENMMTPIKIEELLTVIGELYLQTRIFKKMLAERGGQIDGRN